jgi:hypothetical protein
LDSLPNEKEFIVPPISKNLRTEALRSAPLDSWVAFSEDESRIVANGKTYEEAVKKSEEAGISELILIKTPHQWLSFSLFSTHTSKNQLLVSSLDLAEMPINCGIN